MKRALIILHPDFEELEAIAPIDLLSRAGFDIIQASTSADLLVTGRSGVTLQATHRFDEVEDDFDVIILPGGSGIMAIRKHPLICQKLHHQIETGGIVACICAAPLLLKDAGILKESHTYTAHPSTLGELPDASSAAVVHSGQLITSKGAGTATEFALAIIEKLCGAQSAKEIAESICWPHSSR